MQKLLLMALLLFLQGCSSSPSCPLETLAGLDIGSGSTKMVVVSKYRCQSGFKDVLMEISKPVAYAQDLENRSAALFGAEIVNEGEFVIKELTQIARQMGARHIVGVATAAFRKAQNAPALIKRWNQIFEIDLRIISQDEEALLAHSFIKSQLKESSSLVVWDIGGGSQQFIGFKNHEAQIIKSSLASISFRKKLLEFLQLKSTHPLTTDQLKQAMDFATNIAREQIDSRLDDLLNSETLIYGLGGVHSMSVRHQLSLGEGEAIEMDHLEQVLGVQAQRGVDEIQGPYRETQVSNLLLVFGIMRAFDISSYQWFQANLSHAVLITD